MKKGLFGVLMAGLLSSSVALAHSGGQHVMGTVKSIDASTLTVETKEAKQVAIHLDGATQFERSGAKATAADLKAGERVVVHAKKHGDMLHATLVKFGKQGAAASGTQAGHGAAVQEKHDSGHAGH